MQTPDLTPVAKMARTICADIYGQHSCSCARAETGGHCQAMEETSRRAMMAAGMSEADVAAVLDAPPADAPPAKVAKKGRLK